jgi:thiol-disulfide isomerase/thioredoxin
MPQPRRSLNTFRLIVGLGALLLLASPRVASAQDNLVAEVQQALSQGDLARAESVVAFYRRLNGDTPEAIEAFSWLGRAELSSGKLDGAMDNADQTRQMVLRQLKTRKLDSDPHLALALGAAFEVEAQALAERGQRSEAVSLLQAAIRTYQGTSVVGRLRKNLNLLTLTGKPAPPLQLTEFLFPSIAPSSVRKVQLLFFWAHWCSDCKAEAPIIARIASDLEPKGLTVIGPTMLYGYTKGGQDAIAAEERPYIRQVFQQYYAIIPKMTVPLSTVNFETFGASTTPTLVVIDRQGIVRLYHPGRLSESDLRAVIQPLLPQGTAR